MDWYHLSLNEIKEKLATDFEKGLSTNEIEKRRAQYGPNELPKGKKLRWWELLFRQFKSPLIFILLIAGAATYWLGELIDTSIILLAVSVNVFIGFGQEFRSNRIFEKLQSIISVTTRVRRNGKLNEINAQELVPGDIIFLTMGVKIPADARLTESHRLEVDEALLTGESLPVKKKALDIKADDIPLADRKNMVYAGTVVSEGNGVALVVATGEKTELGQIAKLTASVTDEQTPLQERLSRLGKTIVALVILAALIIIVTGIAEGRGLVEMFTVGVAVAVAAIPEGLPAALSVVLAVASQRIFSKQGLVKTLIGAETLGSTTVICTDKTGTLTEGIMKVEEIAEAGDLNRAALALALANEAAIMEDGTIKGDTTDKAKLEYFTENGGDLEKTYVELPRKALLPFDAVEKYIASFHQENNGSWRIFVTGSPETLINRSVLSDTEKNRLRHLVDSRADQGYRMIGIAERILTKTAWDDMDDPQTLKSQIINLSILGFACLRDPIRAEVKESVAESRQAGIRIIMVTGDHKRTARVIGKALGFNDTYESIMEGSELDEISEEKLAERIRSVEIFSRVSPKHKIQIVNALRNQKEVVAMTGDGVNDAPALKAADVGLALGTGTDITKEAADLVLLNDSFSTITAAIREGRIAFDNMRKVAVFLLMGSFTELILIMSSLVLGIPLPVTAVQILWANIVEDGFPNFALAFEPGEKNVMKRRPFRRQEPILNKFGMLFILLQGLVTDLLLVGVFLWLFYASAYSIEHIRTIILTALATDALILVFVLKNLHEPLYRIQLFDNKYLIFAVFLGFSAMFAAIYLPPLQRLLETVPLSGRDLLFIFVLGAIKMGFAEGIKWWVRQKDLAPTVAMA